jgi:hypothetical protein
MSSFFLDGSSRSGAQGGLAFEALQQRRAPTTERLQITLFVIGRTVFPTTVKDANPLEGQGAEGGVMFGPLLDLLFIIGAGPRRPTAGVGGELVKALAQELGTGPPPMHPARLATLLRDGGDAGELLHFTGLLIALAVGAEGGQQAGRQDRAAPGKLSHRT